MDFFTGIWPIYKTVAHIDVAQAGLIAGVSGFIGEMLQVGFGYLSDRGHRKRMMCLGLFLASAIVWVTFVEGVVGSFLLLLLLMLGSGAYHPAAAGFSSMLFPANKGRAILFFASGGAVGLGVSQLAFGSLLAGFHGHALVVLIPLGALLIGLVCHRFPQEPQPPHSLSLRGFFKPIAHRQRELSLLYISQVINQGVVLAFLFLLPDLLLERGCHTWLCLGGGHMSFILGSAVTMIPAGYLCDRFGQRTVALTTTALSILFMYLFLAQPTLSVGVGITLLACLGGALHIINPIIVSWGNRLVPEHPSTVSALLMGFAWCLSHLGPLCAGASTRLVAEHPFWTTVSWMGLLQLLVLGSFFLMPKLQPVRTLQ
jgi:FSR family fosmidomycin resistance protein-like MFS transporter